MSVIKIRVDDQQLTLTNMPVIASGGIEENQIEFDLSNDWAGFACVACFYRENKAYTSLISAAGIASVPYEVTAKDGKMWLGVMGVRNGVTKTSELVFYKILEGAITEEFDPGEPTPDIYNQILDYVSGVVDLEQRLVAVESESSTNTENIATQTGRIDNMINSQQNESVTTLWTGTLDTKNQSVTLSENINNFDFIDVYIDTSQTQFIRKPVSNTILYEIQTQNMSDDASSQFLRWWETRLTITGTTATINKCIKCYWDDFSTVPVVSQATDGATVVRINGIKIGHIEDDEIVDARVGEDGVTYPNLGDAIRGQFSNAKENLNNSDIIMSKGIISASADSCWWSIYDGSRQNDTSTLVGTVKMPIVGGTKVIACVLGEKYYIFWTKEGTFISGQRVDKDVVIAPDNAAFVAINYLTVKGSNITVLMQCEHLENIHDLESDVASLKGGTISAHIVPWWWLVTNGSKNDVSTIVGTQQFKVEGCSTIQATNVTGEKYYIFWDKNGTYVSYVRADSGSAPIPSNAYYCAFDFLVSTGVEEVQFAVTAGVREEESNKAVVCVRSGNDIQIQSKLFGTSKYIGVNANLVGSQNGGFNLNSYRINDTAPKRGSFITGTVFKDASDDICPIRMDGSYIGGNHGKEPVFKITLANHGKTIEDIGSTWTSANGYDYVIYKIDDTDNISIMGDSINSYGVIVTTTPTAPLTHKSGATHSGSIAFTAVTSQQLRPCINKKYCSVRNDNNEYLIADGVIDGDYIEVVESYRIISLNSLLDYLKSNVGLCTNQSYYDESITDSVLIQNIYRFCDGGGESVCVNITPLGNCNFDFFGGIQSGKIGDDFYVPFTNYDSIQTQDSNTVYLDTESWDSADFPPYKYYQLNDNNGFAVGYCIDTPQGLPTYRKDLCAARAGFFYGSSHKMYPFFYFNSSHPNVYGDSFCFYAFRSPFIKNNNSIVLWYSTASATYMEIELFGSWAGIIEFPKSVLGKEIEVLNKTDTIHIPNNILNTGGMFVTTTGNGSMTLKFK